MRKSKKALLMLGGSMLIAILMIAWPAKQPLAVSTEVIQYGDLVQTVLMNGVVCHRDQQPCISLRSGRIKRVLVERGQQIRQGELLFQLDTAAEEQALSAMYRQSFNQTTALGQLDSAASALLLQNEIDWQQLESQLMAGVEAAQIRASSDGVMGAVYVRENEYVPEGAQLGMTHSHGMQIAVSGGAAEGNVMPLDTVGAATIRGQTFPVRLERKTSVDENGMQMFLFDAIDENEWNEWQVGESVRIEAVKMTPVSGALIPLSAVSADGSVWTIQNGRAQKRNIFFGESNRTHIVADAVWTNQTVILEPDTYELTEGMLIQEK